MTKLSNNFTEQEFLKSDTAKKLGINNIWQNPIHKMNAIMLCQIYLQPIRIASNSSITITSGYRCIELNTAIKGASNSDHQKGLAADIKGNQISLADLFDLIISLHKKGLIPAFDQLIWEYDSWIHLGIGLRRRMQILRKEKGKDYYKITKAPRG